MYATPPEEESAETEEAAPTLDGDAAAEEQAEPAREGEQASPRDEALPTLCANMSTLEQQTYLLNYATATGEKIFSGLQTAMLEHYGMKQLYNLCQSWDAWATVTIDLCLGDSLHRRPT